MRNAVLAVFGIIGWYLLWREPAVNPFPLARPLSAPVQTEVNDKNSWNVGDATFKPLAGYRVTARVMGVERYRFDAGSEFAPYDFALGWGPMSDYKLAEELRIHQGGRWYSYSWGSDGPPLDEDQIIKNSSNHHLVPANDLIRKTLSEIRRGDVVTLRGKLISIEKPGGWHWQSSLSREDTGGGSCELLWVEAVERQHI